MASSDSLCLFFTAWKQGTFDAYNQIYTFAQPDVQTVIWS